MPYNHNVKFLSNGEPVNASVSNRAPQANAANIEYVRRLLAAASAGKSLQFPDAKLKPEVIVGSLVYFDEATASFGPAIAKLTSSLDGTFLPDPQSVVIGVVAAKHTAICGDVVTIGQLPSAVVPQGVTDNGLYFLSATDAGHVTKDKPTLAIPAVFYGGVGAAFVIPHWLNGDLDTNYYRFDLTAAPASDPYVAPLPGDPVVVTNPDSALPGWLPADDAVFGGKAPAGAKFGYNLGQDAALLAQWPPIPASGAYLEMDRPLTSPNPNYEDLVYNTGYKGVSKDWFTINADGIWWFDDNFDEAPFDTDYESLADAPDRRRSSMRLWFSKPIYVSNNAVVTSLRSVDPRLLVLCRGSNVAASAGNLDIKLATDFLLGDDNQRGHNVFKSYDEELQRFQSGPVTEGLLQGSDNVTLTSTAPVTVEGLGVLHRGVVTVSFNANGSVSVPIGEVRLNAVTQETYQNIMYLGMPRDVASSYNAMLHTPADLVFNSPKLRLVFWVIGRAAGTLPGLTLSGRRLPKAVATPTALPTTDTTVGITTGVTLTSADQYVLVTSEPISITAGESYAFTLSRAIDSYPGELGIIRQYATISAS